MDQSRFDHALELVKKGKFIEAKQILEEMQTSNPNNESILEWIIFSTQNDEEKIPYLIRLSKINPNNSYIKDYLQMKGSTYEELLKGNNLSFSTKFSEIQGATQLASFQAVNHVVPPPLQNNSTNNNISQPISQQKPKKLNTLSVIIIALASILSIVFCCVLLAPFRILSFGSLSNPNSKYDYIVYEVVTENQYFHHVDISYNNESGGLSNYKAYFGGPFGNDRSYIKVIPANSGFFAYLSAMNTDVSTKITCNIYFADQQGAKCILDDGSCGELSLWKSEFCTGKYCSCTVSGYK